MDLPDKSNPVARPREKKAPVIPAGAATPTERPARRRLLDFVIAESPKAVVGSVAKQTLLPESKRVLEVVLNNILHGILWNNGGPGSSGMIARGTVIRGNGVVVTQDYNAISQSPQMQAAAAANNLNGPYQDLVLTTQAQAEALLASLIADINQYRMTTVPDLYEAANLTPPPHLAHLGWYSVDGARIVQDSQGYKLMLPKPTRVN